jgi:predicted RNA-binding protein with PUA-like domain
MARWLLKTEPDSYSWDNLLRDKKTTWNGVTNALALKHLRNMNKGDEILIYHTGKERAIIGLAQAATEPYPDPQQDDPRRVVVDIKPKRKLACAVTLDEMKTDKAFASWDLLRNSRLSVMPVPDALWERITAMGKGA